MSRNNRLRRLHARRHELLHSKWTDAGMTDDEERRYGIVCGEIDRLEMDKFEPVMRKREAEMERLEALVSEAFGAVIRAQFVGVLVARAIPQESTERGEG